MMAELRAFWDGGLAARRPGLAAALLGVLAATAAVGLAWRGGWDTEILNLLPPGLPAVRGLGFYQQEFPQSRELAFLLEWEGEEGGGEAAYVALVEALERQNWVDRVMASGSLMDAGGMAAGAALALNQPGGVPREALEESTLAERFDMLARRVRAGSPAAAAWLAADPLGIFTPVWQDAARRLDLENVFALNSEDGRAWIVPVAAAMDGLREEDCRRLMGHVRDFVREWLGQFPPGTVRLGVTGRAAYVAEVSDAMRRDFALTSAVSAVAVLGIFWMAYRTLWPLAGIGLLLALSAALALAAGFLLLGSLNLVAVSFCSILFGLGDDFSLLICQRHAVERARGHGVREAAARAAAEAAPGIRAVAITTAAGFLSLWWSGSAGFAQLGVMVALGITVCAVVMPAFLGLFLLPAKPLRAGGAGARAFLVWVRRHRQVSLIPAAALFFPSLAAAVVLPGLPKFDLSPRSLEPRHSPAAQTLEAMMNQFPAMFEPVMVVLPQARRESLERLEVALDEALAKGWIERFSSPAPLVLDPQRIAQNALSPRETESLRAAARRQIHAAGLGTEAMLALENQIRVLAEPPPADWPKLLAPDSSWWFVLDRMISPAGAAVAYLRLPAHASPTARQELARFFEERVPGCMVTGWSQMLAALIPWARGQLLLFGGGVLVVVLVVLALVYRSPRDWLVHAVTLAAASLGVLGTLKAFGISINLLNVLAFPLILGVGVDYGTHLLLAARQGPGALAATLRAVFFSALTTCCGFGALMAARSPALSGLGFLCALGVAWCFAAAALLVIPLALLRKAKHPVHRRDGRS